MKTSPRRENARQVRGRRGEVEAVLQVNAGLQGAGEEDPRPKGGL